LSGFRVSLLAAKTQGVLRRAVKQTGEVSSSRDVARAKFGARAAYGLFKYARLKVCEWSSQVRKSAGSVSSYVRLT